MIHLNFKWKLYELRMLLTTECCYTSSWNALKNRDKMPWLWVAGNRWYWLLAIWLKKLLLCFSPRYNDEKLRGVLSRKVNPNIHTRKIEKCFTKLSLLSTLCVKKSKFLSSCGETDCNRGLGLHFQFLRQNDIKQCPLLIEIWISDKRYPSCFTLPVRWKKCENPQGSFSRQNTSFSSR